MGNVTLVGALALTTLGCFIGLVFYVDGFAEGFQRGREDYRGEFAERCGLHVKPKPEMFAGIGQ